MIVGTGIDVVSVERIRKAMRNPRFVDRILTPRERETCLTVERVAGRWAAKEALAKAIPSLRSWHAVEIMNNDHGAPTVSFQREDLCNLIVHFSITHDRDFAAAMVVVEQRFPM